MAAPFHRPRLSRRALAGTALGAAGAVAVGSGLAEVARVRAAPAQEAQDAGPNPWREPETILSVDRVLEATLDARPLPSSGVGHLAYDGTIPGPTLRVRPGDTMRVKLLNNLGGKMTNLHVHGLHVSPEGNSDNIFVMLENGQSFDYEYVLPENHPSGLYWYHPHHHGDATEQVGNGLVGAIVVEGGLDDLPEIVELTERMFVIQALQPSTSGASCTVNGVVNPLVQMRPGQSQQWRIANMSANAYVDLELEGHQLHVIGLDGNPVPETVAYDHIQMGPGERVQAVVQAAETGTFLLKSRAWGELGQAQPEFTVATVEVAGDPMIPEPLPGKIVPVTDLAGAEIAAQRIMTFQEGYDSLPFSIDGVAFNPDVVNTTVKLGTVEEWILRNTSADWHPFHIHVDDFQVMSVNGVPFPYVNRQDTVSIPPRGNAVIRIGFTDFVGKFVYHCHILSHEDFGMMSVVEVVP
ncbi:MAG: multicopper oxidase family protein [Chloroflexota bacterium]